MNMNAHAKNVTVIPAKTQGPAPGQPAKKKLRVAAYCRVSTDKDEQLNSFEVQKAYYTEKILSNPNWKMADIFADEGISGVSMKKRDEFKRMLRHCREGRIDMILVKSVSRFGRNTVDVMRTVRSLREKNITVLFEKENLDTSQMTSELMLAFFSAFSQSESESIRGNAESPTLEENALHTAIVNGILNQYINVGADMELLKANLDRVLAPQIPGGAADIRARITELTQQKQELVARCMEENDITKYELLLTKIVDELEQLNQRLTGIESKQKNRAITESRMAEIDALLAQFAENGLQYDDVLTRRLVSAIRVRSADEIEITFKDGKTRTENMQ